MENVRPGNIIKGPNWPEPVEIKLIQERGAYVHIVGATTISRTHIDQIIPATEFSKFIIEEKGTHFTEEPWKVFLGIETIRYRFASMYDPLLAMNTSKVDPLPHQIEAVYGYVLKLPRIRFLIADDPGAGKTIMAGLIIKELQKLAAEYENRGFQLTDRPIILATEHLRATLWRIDEREFLMQGYLKDLSWQEALFDKGRREASKVKVPIEKEDLRGTGLFEPGPKGEPSKPLGSAWVITGNPFLQVDLTDMGLIEATGLWTEPHLPENVEVIREPFYKLLKSLDEPEPGIQTET